ncbi:GGDEF domain-containing protein [Colwellia sp. 4_MG-2023]|jgi:diguanylate cyclase (GGDEF)-like protein|uniref:GGDEF domain-containing protein n=1 Tax=unclassified Colwellia TaxID=196834 RepID=UPI001C0963BE|nr:MULTISPECIES: GGDEF domain-containing protein [unclassified Colwellia]MBU2925167.1 GGDEF domain-containing protein [Colwellia sp. C2M11]MDO6506735.1 GGDEF domain-containing protein [Colwellia sp. 5_MG-2023]MDO6555561.1 GGDEF domain-containing protein [Colwellia sp. 4_MG-2023]MDO6651308.1 GGDEF domain-containing protein [Colwellia sp. 3_MG-2023]MDO6664269.1 GGDEF domain-containing protein [Colwellia sp. 2_MG-2023]
MSTSLFSHFFERNDSNYVDYNRRLYSFLGFSCFGCIALSFFSYINYINNDKVIFLTVFVTLLIFLANLALFYLYKCLDLSCNVISLSIVIFCIVLVYQGGIDNTALYWTFPFPLVLFAMLGYLYGSITNGFVFVSLLLMLNNQEILIAHYSDSEVIRFLSSFFVVNILSFINEYFREHSHSAMTNINISKEQQANTDILTNLPNRRFIDAVFFPASKAKVPNRFPMVLIMADVDNFKSFNDHYGHHTGDRILQKLARTMEKSIRDEDIVSRVGGEEFLIIFSNTDYDTGMKIAEKIRCAVSEMKLKDENQELKITMSLGVTIAHTYSEIESKLKEADEKLYQAKNSGRNCIF